MSKEKHFTPHKSPHKQVEANVRQLKSVRKSRLPRTPKRQSREGKSNEKIHKLGTSGYLFVLEDQKDDSAKQLSPKKVEVSKPRKNRGKSKRRAHQRICHKWFDQIKERGLKDIRLEFTGKIKGYESSLSAKAFKNKENQLKNRYDDVMLLDNSRVKIKLNPNNDDYIHASLIEISPDISFICTQGPMSNTIEQFWFMCIQEGVEVILQLCKNVEDDSEKCVDYLPTSSKWKSVGEVQVKLIEEGVPVPGTEKVTKTMIACKFKDKKVTIAHILYAGWPDRDTPESTSTFCEVRTLVNKLANKKPVVVHCSAGIGRSGSYVGIEMIYHKLLVEKNADFDMIELMHELRDKRFGAVQNNLQYIFIFRGVIEILMAEQMLLNTPEVEEFIKDYDKFSSRQKEKNASKRKEEAQPVEVKETSKKGKCSVV